MFSPIGFSVNIFAWNQCRLFLLLLLMLEIFCFDLPKASGYPTWEDVGVRLITTELRLLSDAFYWTNKPLVTWRIISIIFILSLLKNKFLESWICPCF